MSRINTQRTVSFMYANDNFCRTEEEFLKAQDILLQDEIYNKPVRKIKSGTRSRVDYVMRNKKRKPSRKPKLATSA